mmetsp:Transcript_68179/g.108174  ORF Transcript_68179/g.108174 Transcript_68179/m.108174 type:complete len:342 (-) Transcript_68179:71-1096(-)
MRSGGGADDGKAKRGSRTKAGINFTGSGAWFGNSLLEYAGVKKAERAPPEERAEQAMKEETRNVDLSLWLGARLPALVFIIILGCFTYLYHVAPIVPWLCVFFALDFALIVTWPPKMVGGRRRTPMDWMNMTSWLAHIGIAILVGLGNYGILEAWVNTTFLREYNDVKPTADPMSLQDGGILNFQSGTKLDVDSAAGYKFWLYRYCAAPIVHESEPTAAPISFWAVGIGCCASRGDFTCGSAEEASARSAMPLRPHNLPPEIVDHYDHAIRMSAAANGFEVSKNRMFVMWSKDPHALGEQAWWISSVIFLVLSLVTLCIYQCTSSAIWWSANLPPPKKDDP